MSIYVSGSLAFDRIMTFKGNLHDHILMDKLRMISVSFMVDSMDERRGGCAGNIAYSLALLGEKPVLVAAAGRDFDGYARFLEEQGVSLEGVRRVPDVFTALCYITSDLNGNQITGFYPGAMNTPSDYAFPHLDAATDIGIVSPGNMDDMRRLPAFYKEKGVRYIYDPGQQLPVLSKEDLAAGIEGSFACVTNDYEISMVCKKLELREEDLLQKTLIASLLIGINFMLFCGAGSMGVFGTQALPVDEVWMILAGIAAICFAFIFLLSFSEFLQNLFLAAVAAAVFLA